MEKIPIHQQIFDQIETVTIKFSFWLIGRLAFQTQLKSSAIFVNVTAAYDIIWRKSITYKFLQHSAVMSL